MNPMFNFNVQHFSLLSQFPVITFDFQIFFLLLSFSIRKRADKHNTLLRIHARSLFIIQLVIQKHL